ncbi:hypothetical protein BO82DRAFT_416035 [Aspergillus uvarum CBS 121591]|uniref:Uncharacterized protein n=1 Tax=Aspergillus uvarum CBS 121591 TaxID=1448315 RepID=A0A319CAP2_9EURO|nr:hypothetical protein BO82DRAFT_416035 [Aspergillus uvarum CBS 121591]PYH81330.1 hypothetical protein BO82DRAFT_416035 [Aspergillus uvarum CBS 121591]
MGNYAKSPPQQRVSPHHRCYRSNRVRAQPGMHFHERSSITTSLRLQRTLPLSLSLRILQTSSRWRRPNDGIRIVGDIREEPRGDELIGPPIELGPALPLPPGRDALPAFLATRVRSPRLKRPEHDLVAAETPAARQHHRRRDPVVGVRQRAAPEEQQRGDVPAGVGAGAMDEPQERPAPDEGHEGLDIDCVCRIRARRDLLHDVEQPVVAERV